MEPIHDLQNYEDRQIVINSIRDNANGNILKLLDGVRNQDNDINEDLTRDLYALVRRAGLASENVQERQLCVQYLLEKSEHPSGYLRNLALNFLGEFGRDDFSKESHRKIIQLYDNEIVPELVRVTGVAEVKELKSKLQKLASSPFAQQSTALKVDLSWLATMALARMGDNESARRLIDRVNNESDIVTRATLLFRDLAYTRHPMAHQTLVQYLDSRELLPTLKPEQKVGEKEASYAAKEIATYLNGSPDISVLSDDNEMVSTMKAWLEEQKSLSYKR